jgi:hypothetical protein
VSRALEERQVRAILLKGPALVARLYRDGTPRDYYDHDFLVSPSSLEPAIGALRSEGFSVHYSPRDDPSGTSRHATALHRDRDGAFVDLHVNLPDVRAPDSEAWRVLSTETAFIESGGRRIEVLDDDRLALVVALHAAHHGPTRSQATEDLRRALATFREDVWRSARDLATVLEADEEFAAGLSLLEKGQRLAERLHLETPHSRVRDLRWARAPWGASVLEELRGPERSFPQKLALALRFAFPPPRAMKIGSALARRGPIGLALAYALRPFRIVLRLPAVITSRRRIG